MLKLVENKGSMDDENSIASGSADESNASDASTSRISLRGSISSIANIAAQSTGVTAFGRKSQTQSTLEKLRASGGSSNISDQSEGQNQAADEKENTPKIIVERRASVATALKSL